MSVIVGSPSGGNFTSGSSWVGGVAPTLNDDAVLDATSGNITINSGSVMNSLDCLGYTRTLTHGGSINASIGGTVPGPSNVALRFSSTMTYAPGSSASAFLFTSSSATQQTIDTAGKTVATIKFTGVGGSWKPVSHFNGQGSIEVTGGSFDPNGYDMTFNNFSGTGTSLRSLTIGTANWVMTGSGSVWNMAATTNMTFTGGAANLIFTNASSSAKTLAFGSKTYGANLQLTGPGSGNYLFQGNNSFRTIALSPGVKTSVQSGNTQTITQASGFTAQGTASDPISISNPTQTGKFSMASGVAICDYLVLQNSIVQGGAVWYAGINSVDNGANSGWIFNIGAVATSETVVTSEAVAVVVSDPQVRVSDTVTITEPLNMYAEGMVADFAHITEQVTMQVPVIYLQISDSITTSESFTVVQPLLSIIKSDSITTSEALAITAATDTPLIRTQDHVLIQEGYKPLHNGLGATYFGNLYGQSQNYGLNPQVVTALVIQTSDTVHVTEVFDIGSLSNTAYDTVTVTDSPSFYSDLVATREQITITIQQFTTAESDTVTITEVVRVHAPQVFMAHESIPITMYEPIVIPIVLTE